MDKERETLGDYYYSIQAMYHAIKQTSLLWDKLNNVQLSKLY